MLSKDKAENTNDNDSKCNVTVTQQNKRRGKKRSKKKDKRESKKKENSSLIEFSCDSNNFEISDDNGEDLFCESFVSEESGFGDEIGDDNNTIFFDVSESDKPDEQSVTCFEMKGAISCKEQSIKSIEIYNSRDEIGQEVNSFEVSHVRNSNRQTVNSFEVSYAGHNSEEPVSSFKTFDSEYKSEESAKILLKYCNDIVTCIPENITLNALTYAINTHTERYVKMAIDKSMEAGKFNMAYINGILKNWKREGYPNEDSRGESINGTNSYGKGNIQDTGKFEGFKPKEPRKLTEEERKSAEKNLI